jgi:hypothetical protein
MLDVSIDLARVLLCRVTSVNSTKEWLAEAAAEQPQNQNRTERLFRKEANDCK